MTVEDLRRVAARFALEPWLGLDAEDLVQEGWLRAHRVEAARQEAAAYRGMQDAVRQALVRVGLARLNPRTKKTYRRGLVLSIDALEAAGEPGGLLVDRRDPSAGAELRESANRALDVLGLDVRERRLMVGVACAEPLRCVARELGISECRAAQLRQRAYDRSGMPRPPRLHRGVARA